ncbi:hypothetical protein SUGI_1517860 [Cryptomeria japonica]|uniref:Uncharacterized protein n=1 Tax=Cryptomeria japonica TaxID=3369 RepID=A0AAD3RR52_CRYJA|nr:hypothetical protein SUGI_1450120 [Cryptomeria japonica]GLJ59330.1 hypothetical protein SUGI_1503230 [Cryptomeria japonica]GLJ59656.1 hypothetical protein SUGI_1517860 [Cryptomeria japonica]
MLGDETVASAFTPAHTDTATFASAGTGSGTGIGETSADDTLVPGSDAAESAGSGTTLHMGMKPELQAMTLLLLLMVLDQPLGQMHH